MAVASESKTIVGVFNSVSDAQQAVRDLEAEGITRNDISLVAHKTAAGYDTLDKSDKASDVVADAGIGAAIGGVGGLLLAAAGAITIPVIGPVLAAGPIAAALTGAGIGAAAGGLIGALTESGVPEEDAKYYAEGVRRGDVLVTVKTQGTSADRVCDILDRHNAVDVDDRVSNWKQRGWKGYQTDASPLGDEELRSERGYYSTTGTMGSAAREAGRDVKDAGREFKEDVKDAGRELKHDTQSTWDNLTDRDRDGRNDIGEGLRAAGREVKEFGHDVADTVRGAGHKIAEEGRELRDDARDTERRMENSIRDDEARRRRARVYDHVKS